MRGGGKGGVAGRARPRGGDWWEDEIRGLKKLGIDILVSMLTGEEEEYLELQQEGAAARRLGLQFYAHPIPDRNIPDSPGGTWTLARSLAAEFAAGKKIAVHCRMGIGRSPLLLAC